MIKGYITKRAKIIFIFFIIKLLIFISSYSYAAQEPAEVRFTISAEIKEQAQCIINNNEDIQVFFGEVDISKIDGDSYKKVPINITLSCEHLQNNTLTMQLNGNGASFDSDVLAVPSQEGLGIRLLNGGVAQAINEDFSVIYDGGEKINLEVVLVKEADATLNAGTFNTISTIQVSYQ